jgi:hypothetical protein
LLSVTVRFRSYSPDSLPNCTVGVGVFAPLMAIGVPEATVHWKVRGGFGLVEAEASSVMMR